MNQVLVKASRNNTLTRQHETQFFLSLYFIVLMVLMILVDKAEASGGHFISKH